MIEIIPNWHPVFVHFTIALLLVSAAAHLFWRAFPNGRHAAQLAWFARWNLWLGAASALFTVAAGWYAYMTVNHDAPSHAAMTVHRNWALLTLACFLALASWDYWLARRDRVQGVLFTGLLLLSSGLLLSTAWHGAELVYRHGLGVMSMPVAEEAGHAHEHGDEHADGAMPAPDHDSGHEAAAQAQAEAYPPQTADVPVTETKKSGHSHAPGTRPHKD